MNFVHRVKKVCCFIYFCSFIENSYDESDFLLLNSMRFFAIPSSAIRKYVF